MLTVVCNRYKQMQNKQSDCCADWPVQRRPALTELHCKIAEQSLLQLIYAASHLFRTKVRTY